MDSRAKVEHCRFAFECTQRWGDLAKVYGHPGVRYCATCETPVHYCTTVEAFNQHAAQGHCVALGRPKAPRKRIDPKPDDVQVTLGIPRKEWESE